VLLSAALSFRWGRRAFGSRVGVYSGLFVGTSVGFYLFTRIFIPDAWLGLFIGASLYFFITALESSEGRGWRWHAGYAAAALAVLTKGLVAIVFAGITAAGYLAITGEWRRWREFRLLSGSVVF